MASSGPAGGMSGIERGEMEMLYHIIEIGIVLAAVGGVVAAYFRVRGHNLGVVDLAIFGSLAIAGDVLTDMLVQAAAGPQGEPSA